MLSPDPRGAPCLWVRDGSQPTLHPLPSVGSESDTLAKKRGAWPVHQRACGRQVYSWRTSGVQVTLSKQVTNTFGVSTVSRTPPRIAVN